jgi:hypothetical protein
MSRRLARPEPVDTGEFTTWRERAAKYLRVTTSDSPRVAIAHRALANEVEACRSPHEVLALPDLPDWVAREADALLDP